MKNLRPLILGLVTLIFSIYSLVDILFSKSLLKEIRGTLGYSKVDVEIIEPERGLSLMDETGKIAVLRFNLKNNKQLFKITQRLDIVHDSKNAMDDVNELLKTSKNLSLLLRKHVLSKEVSVYQINADGTVIYDRIEDANDASFLIFFLTVGASILFFTLYFLPVQSMLSSKKRVKVYRYKQQ
ncbi:hypothetical protein SRABI27_00790 [Pedobacter sp. Bi27]|uniref:hypothetical protein n=1 Tax=unclassified Pedobacter TaxID=2628915 RepID=UPI001D32E60A|nr:MULTISPECIES: hypothetical protein [unclassified Pedobacter]CAH0161266.1 hypothetical protein SRABI126_00792 [Pedobacter sp. Bi126]CAH0161883.1 hypothetical protein SRABI27_00790 [Pedobacter sp. Bi27]CAH0280633.1 hypothetical protein SRABI36_04004 [Pedobacter sp. Bi36]